MSDYYSEPKSYSEITDKIEREWDAKTQRAEMAKQDGYAIAKYHTMCEHQQDCQHPQCNCKCYLK